MSMQQRTQLIRGLGALAAASALTYSMALASHADPDAVAQAQERLAAIQEENAEIAEKHAELQDKLAKAESSLQDATQDMKRQSKEVSQLSDELGRLALTQYHQDGISLTAALVTSDDEDAFLNDLSSRQSVTNRANAQLQQLQLAQADLAAIESQAAEVKADIQQDTDEAKQLAEEYAAKEAKAQEILDQLSEEERQRLAEEERKRAEEAARAAEQAAREQAEQQSDTSAQAEDDGATSSSTDSSTSAATSETESSSSSSNSSSTSSQSSSDSSASQPPAASAGSSSRAAQAVAWAKAQVGKPYVFGSTGPNSFDCSGLTGGAWRAAGVSLPRTSQQQYGVGSYVSASNLQPGDLVFYYGGISHVGIYVGNGQIVHASNPRTGVNYAPLHSMPVVGGRRVG